MSIVDMEFITLQAFLDDRLDEDEALQSIAFDSVEMIGGQFVDMRAKVRADSDAKRHILDEALVWGDGCLSVMTRYLAESYDYHPDYREEWRP